MQNLFVFTVLVSTIVYAPSKQQEIANIQEKITSLRSTPGDSKTQKNSVVLLKKGKRFINQDSIMPPIENLLRLTQIATLAEKATQTDSFFFYSTSTIDDLDILRIEVITQKEIKRALQEQLHASQAYARDLADRCRINKAFIELLSIREQKAQDDLSDIINHYQNAQCARMTLAIIALQLKFRTSKRT